MHAITDTLFRVFERAADHMTESELSDAAKLIEGAADQAERCAYVLEGIGCLIDGDAVDGGTVGAFQNDDVSQLLFAVAWEFDALSAVTHMGLSAQARLEGRRRDRATPAGDPPPNVEPITTNRRPKP